MKITYWLLCFVLCASSSLPQSLAEIAKKEKERRKNLPSSKVFREEDLKAAEGRTASETGKPPEPEAGDSRREPSPIAAGNSESESDWEEVFQTFRARYDAAESARDRNRDLFYNGIPIGVDQKRIRCPVILTRQYMPGYMQHAITCSSIKEEIEKQEALMVEIQEECYNAARIRGVVPGRARLQ
jgi:hypothetical protein